MISLNKVRKAVVSAVATENSLPPEIKVFIDRDSYAIIGVRVVNRDKETLKHLVGSYYVRDDTFVIKDDKLSGNQMWARIADKINSIA